MNRRATLSVPGGFSLLEVLVVVAVLGVLAALLLPVLARSKGRAKEAYCTSNLKQVHAAFVMYVHDNGKCPGWIHWQNSRWESTGFIGGKDGRDTNAPAARVRPLFPYAGASDVFRCPADVGIDITNRGGFWMEPSCFDTVGVSYSYNSGLYLKGTTESGLAGHPMEWVQRPAAFILMYEIPAWGGDPNEPRSKMVYWHRARRPGTDSGAEADARRGPRVSPFVFVDGHVKFYDCSGQYFGFPRGFGLEASQAN